MTKYDITVAGRKQPLQVEVADHTRFSEPLSDTDARLCLAKAIGEIVLPELHDIPAAKEVERDGTGQIQRLIDRPATSRNVLAAAIGWEVAGKHLAAAVDE